MTLSSMVPMVSSVPGGRDGGRRPGRRRVGGVALLASALLIAAPGAGPASAGPATPGGPPGGLPVTPLSGVAPGGNGQGHGPGGSSGAYPGVDVSGSSVSVGGNVDVIAGSDVTQQAAIGGTSVATCNAGTPTAQNETSVAVDPAAPSDLVAGANDYRLYEPTENRYDGSGGVYTSSDGGATWSAGYLPGLVKALSSPGGYQSAGDPSISAGPDHSFWYGNLAFDRSDAANSVAVSHSSDGGATWSTGFVIETSASAGATLFNDKDWVAADPTDPTGDSAYVTWTQFHTNPHGGTMSSPVVISRTTDGGRTWSPAVQVSPGLDQEPGSTVVVGADGTVYVSFEVFRYRGHDWAAEAISHDQGATFATRLLSPINDVPSPLPGDTFRVDSFPGLAVDGSDQYLSWSSWNGTDSDVVLMVSHDGGASWDGPLTLAGGKGNQFFPWVSASGGTVAASWYDDSAGGDTYLDAASMSGDSGATWTAPTDVSTGPSDVAAGNLFGYPSCAASFIGDYNAVVVGSDGIAHALWTDVRHATPADQTNQDPYTAGLSLVAGGS